MSFNVDVVIISHLKIVYYFAKCCNLLLFLLIFVADIQMVALGQSITSTPYFHQRARIIFPMILHTRYIHVGKSSFTLEERITDAEHGDVLFSNRRLLAWMNSSTGASERMPEKFR